ncbi:MAG: glycosyltransferase [Syntrophomonadaceae bacterium]|nr:glycosyltransferase [Syntrophomonadaceae bacterium]
MRGKRRYSEREMQNGISVMTCTNRPSFIQNVFDNFCRQIHSWCELIIILNNNKMRIEEWANRAKCLRNIRVYQIDEDVSLGACYNFAVKQARYNYIAKFDDDDYYAPYYLSDAINIFKSIDADIIGKTSRFIYFEELKTLGLYYPIPEFSYVKYVVGATMVIKREVFEVICFPDITYGEDSDFQTSCNANGFRLYSAGKSNYVTIRRASTHGHTFIMDDLTYLSYCKQLCRTDNYIDIISGNTYDDIFK